ncbi:MAG TPA: UTP--glucose-1-phosphate uridylyltransferase [bacterium]|nr:UTP--glucose-1-phosphate uridylyltransferase [bacterium]
MKSIKKAVIPAAGYGTRFLPITKVVPKELLPIGNKPAIHYVVEEAVRSGVEEIILVCHPSKNGIIDYFKRDKDLQIFLERKGKKEEMAVIESIESMANFRVVYQKEPLGLGHAVWCARKEIGDEPFLVILPDVLIADEIPASQYLIDSCQNGDEWGMLVERVTPSEVSSYGIARVDRMKEKVYRLTGAVEKPKLSQAPSDLGILGRYLLPPEILRILERVKAGALGEIQLTDAIDQLARERPGSAVMSRGEIFDIGTPEGLKEAYQYFEEAVGRISRTVQEGQMKVLRRR